MNKNKKLIIALIFTVISIIAVACLQAFGVIPWKFGSPLMEKLNAVSEISLYILVVFLALYSIIQAIFKKMKVKLTTFTTWLTYILLGITIVSIDVIILVWVVAVELTMWLIYITILEMKGAKRRVNNIEKKFKR